MHAGSPLWVQDPVLLSWFLGTVQLDQLDVVCVCQVGGGHSVQWQVSAGEPSRQRRLQADGRRGHEHPGQPEQGRLEVDTQITD